MLRIFLLGLVLIGLATGLRNQWFNLNWDNLLEDVGLPGLKNSQPIDFNRWLIGDPDGSESSS